jgi:hypothetical protein
MGAFHPSPPEQKRLSTADWDDRGWPVHLSELEDDGVAEEESRGRGPSAMVEGKAGAPE